MSEQESVREFGHIGVGLGDTFAEVERVVGSRDDRPKKVEVGWWTMSALRKLGEQRRAEADHRSLFVGFLEPEAEVMRDVVHVPVPVWIDPALAPGVIRVYWVEDNVDRLAEGAALPPPGPPHRENG